MGDLFFAVAGLAGGNQLAEETIAWRDRARRALRAAVAQQGWVDVGGTVTVTITVYENPRTPAARELTTVMEAVAALTGGENPVLPPPTGRIRVLTFYERADDGATVASGEAPVGEGVGVTVKARWAQ